MYKECDICKEYGNIVYFKNKKTNEIYGMCEECTSLSKLDDKFNEIGEYSDLNDYSQEYWDDMEEVEPPKES